MAAAPRHTACQGCRPGCVQNPVGPVLGPLHVWSHSIPSQGCQVAAVIPFARGKWRQSTHVSQPVSGQVGFRAACVGSVRRHKEELLKQAENQVLGHLSVAQCLLLVSNAQIEEMPSMIISFIDSPSLNRPLLSVTCWPVPPKLSQ